MHAPFEQALKRTLKTGFPLHPPARHGQDTHCEFQFPSMTALTFRDPASVGHEEMDFGVKMSHPQGHASIIKTSAKQHCII
jgi:hypothetical protein